MHRCLSRINRLFLWVRECAKFMEIERFLYSKVVFGDYAVRTRLHHFWKRHGTWCLFKILQVNRRMFRVYISFRVVFYFIIYFYFKITFFGAVFINVSAHDFGRITLCYRLSATNILWGPRNSWIWSNTVHWLLTSMYFFQHFWAARIVKILWFHFCKLLFWFRWWTNSRRLLILHLLYHRKLGLCFLNLLVDFMVDYDVEVCEVGPRWQNLALNQILINKPTFTSITFPLLIRIFLFLRTFPLAQLIFGRLLLINDLDKRILVLLLKLHF